MKSLNVIAFIALLATPMAASAATVSLTDATGGSYLATVVATGSTAWGKVDQSQSTALPNGAYWSTSAEVLPNDTYGIAPDVVADPCMYACSPYYGGVYGSPTTSGAAGWETTPFFTVFAPLEGESTWMHEAVLTFTKAQSSLSLLWGSPDKTNLLELLLGGKVVASFWGADFNWFWETDPGIITKPGHGAALLKLSGIKFDSVRFAAWTDGGSFEFSNVTASPVPLPPAILALIAGLGALGMVSRKRGQPAA